MSQKRVFFYRHGPKAKEPKTGGGNLAIPLTQEGVEKMMDVAQSHVQKYGQPSAIFCSPANRAYQTAMCFALKGGRNHPILEDCLLGRHEEWGKFSPDSKTALDFYNDLPDFMEEEAMAMWLFVKRVARGLAGMESAVCVGHGGLIETIVAMAIRESRGKSDVRDSLPAYNVGEGEAVVFVFDGETSALRHICRPEELGNIR